MGFSRRRLTAAMYWAPSAPLVMRWSADRVSFIVGRDELVVLVVGRALDDATHGDYRGLRRVDDGGEALDAEHAHVGDGDGAALVLVGREIPVASALGEVLGLLRDGSEALLGGVPDDRGYEALVQGHGHRHVHLLVQLYSLGGVEGVEFREVFEGHRTRLHDEVVDGELYLLLGELLVELRAQGHRL